MARRGRGRRIGRVTDLQLDTAVAWSLDGRHFAFEAPLDGLDVRVGGYVSLGSPDGAALGQVHELTLAHRGVARGDGTIVDGGAGPFDGRAVAPAAAADVAAWLGRCAPRRAALPFAELVHAPGVPFVLDAGGFGRHTFLCGQSGSGKTYALGGVLERLVAETSLRLVILDPNSDHVRLHHVRDGVDAATAARYAAAAAGVAVRRAGADGAARLRLRFARLDRATQAAALRLDPIGDSAEYAALLDAVERADGEALSLEDLDPRRGPGAALHDRARNLGVLGWGVWARGDAGSLDDELRAPDPRVLVVDLGSLATREEQALVAASTLGQLWADRATRRPTLIVIDEAHNVCPQEPDDPLTAIAAEHVVRIAGEGRKFGLHLLVATQRPQKVHDNVRSQCDNLLLMRMNSLADLEHVRAGFSFVPAGLVERATDLRLGECVVGGPIGSHPAIVKVGPRLAHEGGGDVAADWAAPRP
jgi:DNA helicase HerA-like ATPase